MVSDLALRRRRAGTGEDHRRAAFAPPCRRIARARADEVRRQAERDAGTAGDQPDAGGGDTDPAQILVGDGIDDHDGPACRHFRADTGLDRGSALQHRMERHVTDPVPGLRRQPAADVRIGHRCQRVVLHAGFVEQPIADEQVALEQLPAGGGKDRADDRPVGAELVHQGVDHRADIAFRRRIEGRAIFEEELPAALCGEPAAGLEALAHGLRRRAGTCLQRDDAGIDPVARRAVGRADILDGVHSLPGQHQPEIARTREIVSDTAQQHLRDPPFPIPFRRRPPGRPRW